MHAIIIEKDELNAQLVFQCLKQLGYTSFFWASSAAEAVRAALENRPNLITADVKLRQGSGIDAVRAICEISPVPVLFVVGDPGSLADDCPGAAVLHKPFSLRLFAEKVEQAESLFLRQHNILKAA